MERGVGPDRKRDTPEVNTSRDMARVNEGRVKRVASGSRISFSSPTHLSVFSVFKVFTLKSPLRWSLTYEDGIAMFLTSP